MLSLKFEQYKPVPDDDPRLKGAAPGETQYDFDEEIMYVRETDWPALMVFMARHLFDEPTAREVQKTWNMRLN